MQRVYTTSCPSRFCGQALDTKTCRDRTSSWCQDFLSSWQTWNRNTDSLYIWRQHQCLGGRVPRPVPQRGWVNRLPKHLKKPDMERSKRSTSMQFIWWPHSYSWKKVRRHHCKWVQPQIRFGISVFQKLLENWYVMNTAVTEKQMVQFIGDWYVRNWNLLLRGKDETPSPAEKDWINHIWKGWQQDTISVLSEFLRHFSVSLSCSKTHWERYGRTRIDGSCSCTFQLETVLSSPSMFILSWRLDSLLGEQKAEKDDRLSSSLPLDPRWNEIEETIQGGMSKRRKAHNKTECKRAQDAVHWIHLARAQEKGITFWQTKSHAIIAHKTVLPDCIERVISQKGETTLYQQQQQQQHGHLGSCGKLQRERHAKEVAGNCKDNTVVREKGSFKSIFEWMECHKTSYTRSRSGWPKYRH